MKYWDELAAIVLPLLWGFIGVLKFLNNRRKKQEYYAAETSEPENKPVHPEGAHWDK